MRDAHDGAWGERRGPAASRRPRGPLLALALLAIAPPVGAQFTDGREAPLRFAVGWARGAPRGDLAEVTGPLQGFAAWLSLPLTRGSAVGLRAEFSVLTVPEQVQSVAFEGAVDLDVTVRGTIGFTGVGPRLEVRAGPLAFSAAVMGGYARVITDVTGRITHGAGLNSVAVSESDYALAGKVSGDLYLPVYRGSRNTALVATAGFDVTTGGRAKIPRRDSFNVGPDGTLELERPNVRPTMLVLRAGVSAEF